MKALPRARLATFLVAVALFAAALPWGQCLRAQDTEPFRPVLEHLLARLASKPLSDWYQPAPGDSTVSATRFGHAIDKAKRRGDAAGCLRLDLRCLAAHGTGDDFPRRLWEAAADADWAERKFGTAVVDPGVCATLLSLCDELPAGQKYFLEGRFLRAKRFARSGDAAGEQAILGQIVATPNLPFDFLAPACKMLGESLEASGDYRGAVDTYDLLEGAADRYSAAADCLLRAVLLNLRLGNDDEAARLLRILQQAPPEVIQGAAGATQIREMVALVETGQSARLSLGPRTSPFGAQAVARTDSAAVARWIKSGFPAWFTYAEEDSQEANRPQNPAVAQHRPVAELNPAEQIKLLLLAAEDAASPIERRHDSFREAVRRLLKTAPDYRRFDALAASVIDNRDIDQGTRMLTLESALAILAQEERREEYGSWRNNPLTRTFPSEFQAKLAVLDREAVLDRASPREILRAADQIRSRPMTSFDELTMGDLLGFLLRLGELQAAEVLASTLPTWPLDAGASQRADAIKAEFARQIQQARSLDPVHEALASALRARFPESPRELPEAYRDLRLDAGMPFVGEDATFQACRYLVETRQFSRVDLQFWSTLLRSLPRDGRQAGAVADLLRSGLGAADGDGIRAQLIALFFTSVDVDNADVRNAVEAEFAPYRGPAGFPQSAFAIRVYEVQRDLRLGRRIDLASAFADLDDPRSRAVRIAEGMRICLLDGDRDSLQQTLDRVDPEHLLGPGLITLTIPAYRLLGRDPGMAMEAARSELRNAVLDSWLQHDESSGNRALDLALAIGDSGALPAGWVREMETGIGDPLFQGRVRVVEAYLDGNWTRLEAEASWLNREYPTSYSYYWYRGLALHNLGRDREAAAALAIYTRHAHDELDYPRAVALLRTIGQLPP